jgi:hypothetical protein
MSTKPHNHTADENSPLLNGGASSALNDTLGHRNGNGHISLSRDSSTMTFLFDSKHTPGIDNSNIAVRSLAYSWHIAKVTLLSSMFALLDIRSHTQLTLFVRLCQLSSCHGTSRYYRWQDGLGLHCRFHHQLLRYYPTRCCSVVCDRRVLDEAW